MNSYSWSSDGSRVAVSYDDAPAVVIYSAGGERLATYGSPGLGPGPGLLTAPGDEKGASDLQSSEKAGVWFTTGGPPVWSSDDREIAYVGRSRHELCDEKSGAILLATTDGSFQSPVAWIEDGCVSEFEETIPPGGWVHWDPGTRSLLYEGEYFNNEGSLWAIHLDEDGRVETLLEGALGYSARFTPSGEALIWESTDDATNPQSVCFGEGVNDMVGFSSLMNLTVDLRPRAAGGGGAFLVDGTAIDLYLSRWWLDYAEVSTPGVWHPVAPPASTRVIDDRLTSWIPPRPGTYQLRLSVEDKAGNLRRSSRVVSFSATPSITDLYVDEPFISPNGDGILEVAEIHYRALTPVHLLVEISDSSGIVVRRLEAEHLGPEPGMLRWNGLSDGGTRVPDGTYRLQIQDSEFFVTVDTLPPVIEHWALNRDAQCDFTTGNFKVELEIAYRIQEESLGSASVLTRVERATVVSPSDWQHFQTLGLVGSSGELPLGLDSYTGARFRLAAEDVAGNQAIASTDWAEEDLFLQSVWPVETNTGLPAAPESCSSLLLLPQVGPLGFRMLETVARPIHELFVQYQPLPIDDASWLEQPVESLFPPDPGNRFVVDWDMESVQAGQNLAVRFRSLDAGGGDEYSRALTIRSSRLDVGWVDDQWWLSLDVEDAEIYRSLLLRAGLGKATPGLVWGEAIVDSPWVDFSLLVSSSSDSRYQPARIVPVAAQEGKRFVALIEDPRACLDYSLHVSAEHIGGELTKKRNRREPCLELSGGIGTVPLAECGSDRNPPVREIALTPKSLDGEPLQLLTLTGPNPLGEPQLLFSANGPADGVEISWDLDLTEIPEGRYPLTARLTNVNGEEIVFDFSTDTVRSSEVLVVDHTPPTRVEITSVPPAGVCEIGADLWVRGVLEDSLGVSAQWQVIQDGELLGGGIAGKEGRLADLSGLINRIGLMTFMLDASDEGGFRECREVDFVLDVDGTVLATADHINPSLFSPNGDGSSDTMALTVHASEASLITSEVLAPGVILQAPPTLVQTLGSSVPVDSETLLFWDGTDLGGAIVADGLYTVQTRLSDSCLNERIDEVLVEVDTTPPLVSLDYPRAGDPLTMILEVVGTAMDKNLLSWTLDFGVGGSPTGLGPDRAESG